MIDTIARSQSPARGTRVHLVPGCRVAPGGSTPATGARAIVLGRWGSSSLLVVIVERIGWQLVESRNVVPVGDD